MRRRFKYTPKNIVNEALRNKDSFLFHEAEGYESGLLGYHKPLSQAMFSNIKLVETVGTLLDPDLSAMWNWDADQWEAYCRVVLLTFRDYVEKEFWQPSFVLYRAKGHIEHAVSDLYKIDGVSSISVWDDDVLSRLRIIVKFITDVVEILEKKGVPKHITLRIREKNRETFYDHLSKMIFEVIDSASTVRSPESLCWQVQHNSVWSKFFNFRSLDGVAGKIVKFKVRRLIYDEVAKMKEFPNFQGARILGYCLNVMGLTIREQDYYHDSSALQKALLSWTKKNYLWLHSYNPRIAKACLVDGFTFDAKNVRLVKTYPAEGLRREPESIYFSLDSLPPDREEPKSGDLSPEKDNSA